MRDDKRRSERHLDQGNREGLSELSTFRCLQGSETRRLSDLAIDRSNILLKAVNLVEQGPRRCA